MTRYRKKPVEVEAWQVGSDEPMPEWMSKVCLFDSVRSGTWIVLVEEQGKKHIETYSQEKFEATFEVVE